MLNEKFWLAIAFFSLLMVLIKYAWPHIARTLDSQSKQIAEEILAAKEMKEKAAALLIKAEKYHDDALHYAQKLVKDAEDESKKFAAESKQILEAELAKKTAAAIERIKLEESHAMREVKTRIIASALETVRNDLAKNMSAAQHDELLKRATSDFEKING